MVNSPDQDESLMPPNWRQKIKDLPYEDDLDAALQEISDLKDQLEQAAPGEISLFKHEVAIQLATIAQKKFETAQQQKTAAEKHQQDAEAEKEAADELKQNILEFGPRKGDLKKEEKELHDRWHKQKNLFQQESDAWENTASNCRQAQKIITFARRNQLTLTSALTENQVNQLLQEAEGAKTSAEDNITASQNPEFSPEEESQALAAWQQYQDQLNKSGALNPCAFTTPSEAALALQIAEAAASDITRKGKRGITAALREDIAHSTTPTEQKLIRQILRKGIPAGRPEIDPLLKQARTVHKDRYTQKRIGQTGCARALKNAHEAALLAFEQLGSIISDPDSQAELDQFGQIEALQTSFGRAYQRRQQQLVEDSWTNSWFAKQAQWHGLQKSKIPLFVLQGWLNSFDPQQSFSPEQAQLFYATQQQRIKLALALCELRLGFYSLALSAPGRALLASLAKKHNLDYLARQISTTSELYYQIPLINDLIKALKITFRISFELKIPLTEKQALAQLANLQGSLAAATDLLASLS